MSKEIVEAVRGLAAEKNISFDKLMEALEDALLSAYKKTPGSAPYARVEVDRDSGDFMVWELKIPPELEEQLLVEATEDQLPTVDPETGEMREVPEPEIDLEKLKRNVRLLLPLAGIALPLLYYLILPKIDAGWATFSRGPGPHRAGIPLLGWLTTFGPAALASVPGWRTRATSDRQRLLRLWPIAVLITFVAAPTGRFEAFAGVSVPLALLAVQGWRRVLEKRRLGGRNPRVLRFLVTAGVVVLVFGAAPATTRLLIKYRLAGRAVAQLDRPDADALDYLARQPRGGVLSTAKVGIWVPALTDDSTYVGHSIWSPQWARRRDHVNRLFDDPGQRPLSPAAALALIEQPGARYVLEPCGAREQLWPLLEPRGYSRHTFGCANVYSPGRSAQTR